MILFGGDTGWGNEFEMDDFVIGVADGGGRPVGTIVGKQLEPDGTLRLGFASSVDDSVGLDIQWWQLAERLDRPGYPRIDPQSGGSGLPGAKGEDEDPAYYSERDYNDPELAPRIFADGKYWLLDRPTHDSGFYFESWLVRRTGAKSVVLLSGLKWGITVRNGELRELHHPLPIVGRSHFQWHDALRTSGFGAGWEITMAARPELP